VGGGYAIAGTALSQRGSPYKSGGADPSGFDCSGLVRYAYAQHGIQLPRTVSEQFREGSEVGVDSLEAGDLIFFRTNGQDVSHVGIAIGGDEFVHAPGSGRDVRVERLGSSYWAPRLAAVKRIR
jgi:cell wall-associated NlpC family hydrolase